MGPAAPQVEHEDAGVAALIGAQKWPAVRDMVALVGISPQRFEEGAAGASGVGVGAWGLGAQHVRAGARGWFSRSGGDHTSVCSCVVYVLCSLHALCTRAEPLCSGPHNLAWCQPHA